MPSSLARDDKELEEQVPRERTPKSMEVEVTKPHCDVSILSTLTAKKCPVPAKFIQTSAMRSRFEMILVNLGRFWYLLCHS